MGYLMIAYGEEWEVGLMGGAWRFTYTRASHQKRSLSSGSGRRHAWTSRPTGRYRNLGSLFGCCYGATVHTLLVSYSSRVVAVLSDLASNGLRELMNDILN